MSDIERFVTIWGGGGTMPASNGNYVRYDDHRAEVERVMADVVKLRIELNSAQVEASQRRGEVERLKNAIDHLTSERNEARAEVERLKEQVGALTLAVEQADEMKAHAEAAAAAEEAETDRVMAERDAAQAEVERLTQELDGRRATNQRIIAERDLAQGERERLQDLLTCERQELSTLRERLFQLRSDQPAQNFDMANGQAILDSSRPTDEDIWREAFMKNCEDAYEPNLVGVADRLLALYRERWPR